MHKDNTASSDIPLRSDQPAQLNLLDQLDNTSVKDEIPLRTANKGIKEPLDLEKNDNNLALNPKTKEKDDIAKLAKELADTAKKRNNKKGKNINLKEKKAPVQKDESEDGADNDDDELNIALDNIDDIDPKDAILFDNEDKEDGIKPEEALNKLSSLGVKIPDSFFNIPSALDDMFLNNDNNDNKKKRNKKETFEFNDDEDSLYYSEEELKEDIQKKVIPPVLASPNNTITTDYEQEVFMVNCAEDDDIFMVNCSEEDEEDEDYSYLMNDPNTNGSVSYNPYEDTGNNLVTTANDISNTEDKEKNDNIPFDKKTSKDIWVAVKSSGDVFIDEVYSKEQFEKNLKMIPSDVEIVSKEFYSYIDAKHWLFTEEVRDSAVIVEEPVNTKHKSTKYYAVRMVDNKIVNKIFTDWEECKALINGVIADFKAFDEEYEARAFINKKPTDGYIIDIETGEVVSSYDCDAPTVDMSNGMHGHKWYSVLSVNGKYLKHIFSSWSDALPVCQQRNTYVVFKSFKECDYEEAKAYLTNPWDGCVRRTETHAYFAGEN